MSHYLSPGQFKSLEDFEKYASHVAPSLEIDRNVEPSGPLASSKDVFGRTLSNRFCVHPMEGWDAHEDGTPSNETLRRWRRFGQSGAKLIWGGEAFAVCADGRANPHQLFNNKAVDIRRSLEALKQEIIDGHREVGEDPNGLVMGLQLTHSGRFSRPSSMGPAPRIAVHHPILDLRMNIEGDRFHPSRSLLSDQELETIAEDYVAAAKVAHACGFDFVDVKCCHGYLLHELLGATTRGGAYGGSFENRTRLVMGIIESIQSNCPGLGIGVRASLGDVIPYEVGDDGIGEVPRASVDAVGRDENRIGFGVGENAFDLKEPFEFLERLKRIKVTTINVTVGSPYTCPHLQRPAAIPPSDGYKPPEDPLQSVARHLELVRTVKAKFPHLTLVGTGYSYLQHFLPNVAQCEVRKGHVDFIGLGRMVLSYPEMPLHVLRGIDLDRRRLCRTLSDCTTAPRNGLKSGCYPLDPYYRALPEYAHLKEIKKRNR